MKSLVNQIASFVLSLLLACTVIAQNTVQVEIDSVDFGNKSISVIHNGKLRELAVAPSVEITLEGKRAELASLLPGSTALVTYDKETAAVTSIAAKRAEVLPAEKLAEGWDEIDDRLIFLMVRLASTEASLEAIDKALIASNRNQARKTGQAKQADKKNEDMDRMGGGPMKWQTFYGRTAESFFYHPTDRNTSYHTETILSQQSPSNDNQSAAGVPSRQGLPVHQRPPQFDYLYRANESAKARAENEIAEMKGKVELLTERKRNLEAEQAGLWCEVAFHSVSHYDLDKKPLYRFEPIFNVSASNEARYQFETLRGAASFMALALSIVDSAQKDQSTTFSKIKPAVAKARQELNDAWLRIGVDVTDRKSVEGKFNALAKKLEESASNLSDSYVVALEGDRAKDQQRKDTFRALLQESIIKYAEIILAIDEMATLMKDEWKIKPDVDTPIKFVSLANVEGYTPFQPASSGVERKTSLMPKDVSVFNGHSYKIFREVMTWHEAKRRCEEIGGHLATIASRNEENFLLSLAKNQIKPLGKLDGVWVGATDELKEGDWNWIDSTPLSYTNWGPGQPNNKQDGEHYLLLYLAGNNWSDQPDRSEQHTAYFVCEWDYQNESTGADAAIIIETSNDVIVRMLEEGQPRLYNSNPLRVIEGVAPELSGWQFTSIPQKLVNSYVIKVNVPCTIYAFGGSPKQTPAETFGKDVSLWRSATGAITGKNVNLCFKRQLNAGEILKIKAFELQIAAERIEIK